MAKVTVYNLEKSKVGEVEVPDSILNEPIRKDLLHSTVRWQLASRRQGTHSTKTRGLVSGGGKKPFKQKGTGNARQGSSRSPLMPGGGITFGPQPRSYDYTMPRKMKQKALRVALSYLHKEGRLFVVDTMESKSAKTKDLVRQLTAFGLKKAVLVDQATDAKFDRASRNLTSFRYYAATGLNVYDLLKYDSLLLTSASLAEITRKCGVES